MKTKYQQLKMSLLAVIVLALAIASRSLGINYKAIDLTSSGFKRSYAYGTSGTQQVGWGSLSPDGSDHAMLWSGSADSFVDLSPRGFSHSYAYGTSGTQQVGSGFLTIDGSDHALLWSGTADSYIDLKPSGFYNSYAYGISGTQQVGYGWGSPTQYYQHALLWSGSADNFIDLHPNGFDISFAYGTNGTQQVGWGRPSASGYHALLWSGSAESYIDLNPSGFYDSYAYGISGTQQVGYGWGSLTDWNNHALLWSGSAESCIDLNPDGFVYSVARGTNGTQQVGEGSGAAMDYYRHALLWNGSADNYIDLHQFLPAGFFHSSANAIDSYGNIVGFAVDSSGADRAFLWQPVLLVADAGLDRTAYAWIDGIAEVNLDGSGSYDEDGDELTYSWNWTIDGNDYEANGINPTIKLPVGQHVISLIVNDGTVDSEPNEVNITVVPSVEANLCVIPKVLNYWSNQKRIIAMIRLPNGITKDQIDTNEPILIYPGQIEADWTWISRYFDNKCRAWNTTIFALFDRDELIDAIDGNGQVELVVVGRLKTGQYFFGTDDVRVICPGRWHHRYTTGCRGFWAVWR